MAETGPGTGGPREAPLEPDPDHPDRVRAADDAGPTGEGKDKPAAAYNDLEERPAAEHPDKVAKPSDLQRPTMVATLKRTVAEFGNDQCTDLAAALTYYAVLAVFPGLIALLSLLGVVGQADSSTRAVIDILRPLVSDDFLMKQVQPFVESLARSDGAGIGLVVGVVGALFSASGYVGAFGRAMNRILEVEEGRPIWVLRPVQFLVTLVAVLLVAAALVILVVSGGVAESVGNVIGVGGTALTVWGIAKWPVLLVIVVLVVALLYYATPNAKQPHVRWLSVGAFTAIMIWLVASVGFAVYVANFGSYNKTYGSLAFVVVALLWIWITNVALLFGAELDSELERSRELESGIAAEESLQLPLRDDREIKKAEKKRETMLATARGIRAEAEERGADRPQP